MTDNVLTLAARPKTPESEARAAFLTEAGKQFDHFVEHEGREPDAFVFSFARSDGGTLPGWLMRGDAERFSGPMVAYAAASLNAAMQLD